MKLVQELRPLGSRYDVMDHGRVVRLVLDPCSCGVHARWVIERDISEGPFPTMLIQFMGPTDGKRTYEHTIQEWHWKPTRWQRLIGAKMQPNLMRWIQRSRQEILEVFAREAELEKFKQMLETRPDGTPEPGKPS